MEAPLSGGPLPVNHIFLASSVLAVNLLFIPNNKSYRPNGNKTRSPQLITRNFPPTFVPYNMNPSKQANSSRDYLVLLVVTLIAWWPLSLNFFSLKNDALVQYIAYRYHLSEAIQHGHLPFWSPYLYTGFPIHADMQGEVWNPLVLVLSAVTRYNMSVFQWEVLIYFYLGAVGMYRLGGYLGWLSPTKLTLAIAFICCGYMTDSISVVPWIPSAAFTPFIILYFLRLLERPSATAAIKLSFAVSLQFLCGYPSFFIFLSYLLFFGFIAWAVKRWREGNKKTVKKAVGFLAMAYGLFVMVCSPALVSYYDFLPYYSRGSGLDWTKAQSNPFPPMHSFSYVLANAFSKNNSGLTDISMRNGYTGLFIFLFFIGGLSRLRGFRLLVAALTAFSFLFSLGASTPVQEFCYRFLPFMDTFRHPGTIRVFTTIGILLLAAFQMDRFFGEERQKWMEKAAYVLGAGLILLIGWLFFSGSLSRAGWTVPFSPAGMKQFLDLLTFHDLLLVIALMQLVFLGLFIFFYRKKSSSRRFLVLFALNSLVFGWIGLPFTAVSKERTASVNRYIASFPDGYPLPDVRASVEAEVISDSINISPYGYHNFYNKKITIQDEIITPTLNSDYDGFLNRFDLRRSFTGAPFIFIADTTLNDSLLYPAAGQYDIKVKYFSPNAFVFEVNSNQAGPLFIFQQYNHNWEAKVDGQETPITKSNMAFMSISVPQGRSVVEFSYRPVAVYRAMMVSGLVILVLLYYFVLRKRNSPA
jgi:hypothetical protein